MKINPIQPNYNNYNSQKKQSFKGYDARPVKALVARSYSSQKLTEKVRNIFAKHDIPLILQFGHYPAESLLNFKFNHCDTGLGKGFNAQDFYTIANNKLFSLGSRRGDFLHKFAKQLGLEFNAVQKTSNSFLLNRKRDGSIHPDAETFGIYLHDKHITSSNLFIVKDGEDEVALVGADDAPELFDLEYYGKLSPFGYNKPKFKPNELQEVLGVKKIIPLPQIGGNLDQFIRPLDNKRILLADEQMSFEIIKEIERKYCEIIKNYGYNLNDDILSREGGLKLELEVSKRINLFKNLKNTYNSVTQSSWFYKPKDIDYVEKKLTENGFEVIRIPGRIFYKHGIDEYSDSIARDICALENPLNSIAVKDKNNELIFVASTYIDRLLGLSGHDFEDALKNIMLKHIKPENLHIIRSKDMWYDIIKKEFKGLHSEFLEVPENGKPLGEFKERFSF